MPPGGRRGWPLALDAYVLALTVFTVAAEWAPQLFKVAFFLLIFGAFFWDLRSFAARAAFWTAVTTSVLAFAVLAGRAPATELVDVPFFVAVLVMVFAVSKRRAEAQEEVRALLVGERERANRLRELAALKADFSAMVAHELGNPVTAIRRLAELMRSGGHRLTNSSTHGCHTIGGKSLVCQSPGSTGPCAAVAY